VVRNGITGREAEETAIEEVSFEHEFYLGVRMAIDLLDDEDFEHEYGVIGFTADLSGMELAEDFFKRSPVNEFIDVRKDIFR
ncbi:MAG: hypothetical protein Q9M37_05990, partial [Desulfonauticus sp.]|nr:hypothetical protein [Desulfonauticus sp.]